MAFASGSTVGGSITWDGNGTSGDPPTLNTPLCGDSADYGGITQLPPGADSNHYLLWIFTVGNGNTITQATLTTNGDTTTWPTDAWTTASGNQIKFITKAYDLSTLIASVSYVGALGSGTANLNISHGCVPGKASPDIATDSSGEGVTGDTLSDTAHLTNGFTPPSGSGGTVTFTLYGPGDDTCSTALYTNTVDVTWESDGTADVSSDDSGTPANGNVALTTGTYQWIASYSGNDQNEAAGPTSCNDEREANVVTQSAPTVETKIHLNPETNPPTVVTEVSLGDSVHDSATVTPASDLLPTPTGSVTFTFYTGTCDAENPTKVFDDTVDLVNGVADPSKSTDALAAGDYHWLATYTPDDASDDIYTGGDALCEPLTVNKGTLAIVTKIHDAKHGEVGGDTHVALGSVVHDTAHVTGQVTGFDPDLTKVGFAFYTSGDCTTGGSLAGNTGADEVTDPDVRSGDTQALGAGSYSFRARFAGDANYNPVPGGDVACEPLTVDKGTLSIVTKIHDASHSVVTFVPVGGVVHDTAHVTGQVTGFDPDLTKVGFAFYTTIDCTGEGALAGNTGFDEVVTTDVRSGDSAALASGAYSFRARFAGDDNYNPVPGGSVACEPLSVRTFGKTMGYWGNRNGQARIPASFTYTLGQVSATTCSLAVTKANTTTILPNTKNGVSLLTNCMTVASRDSGINTDSMNVLLAQALALKLNIDLVTGFNGQQIAAFGAAAIAAIPTTFPAGQSLTSTSTVQQVLDYANYLIAQSKLNNGVVITQAMIGQLNTLLGLINAEAT